MFITVIVMFIDSIFKKNAFNYSIMKLINYIPERNFNQKKLGSIRRKYKKKFRNLKSDI